MSSRGGAPNCDSFGVDSIFLGISPKPTDGRLAIMDLGRPFCFPTQPVGNRGTGKPARFDQGRQSVRTVTASLIPVFPPSAMYPDDEWSTSLTGCRVARNCQVKGLPGIVSLRIGQGSEDLDVGALRDRSSRAKNKCRKEKTDRGFVQLVSIPP